MRYRKKPIEIEAVQWTGNNLTEVAEFMGITGDWFMPGDTLFTRNIVIRTLEGNMTARTGDYIIKGVHGEFYPCKPEIFEETYEEADNG